jgi:hypothetical protein
VHSNTAQSHSPLEAAEVNHNNAARQYAFECRQLARQIANFMAEYDLQVRLSNGTNYRTMRLTWGTMCNGEVCMPNKDRVLVLLRDGRVINNERRGWTCQRGVEHMANRAKYIVPEVSLTEPAAHLGGFEDLKLFLAEAPELIARCKELVDTQAKGLTQDAARAREMRELLGS